MGELGGRTPWALDSAEMGRDAEVRHGEDAGNDRGRGTLRGCGAEDKKSIRGLCAPRRVQPPRSKPRRSQSSSGGDPGATRGVKIVGLIARDPLPGPGEPDK